MPGRGSLTSDVDACGAPNAVVRKLRAELVPGCSGWLAS